MYVISTSTSSRYCLLHPLQDLSIRTIFSRSALNRWLSDLVHIAQVTLSVFELSILSITSGQDYAILTKCSSTALAMGNERTVSSQYPRCKLSRYTVTWRKYLDVTAP